jgi:hypothetical protein
VGGGALIAGAIVAAALILSWSKSSSAPKYQLAGGGSAVVRMDTDSGELIACDKQGCVAVQEPDRAKVAEELGLKQKPRGNAATPKIP